MKKIRLPILAALLLPALALTSCGVATPGQGAKTGAIVGGITGGIVEGNPRGALIGGAIGAASGALVGALVQESRYSQRVYDEQGEVPYAQRTETPGFVESPYRPYNIIDVRGIPRGARVLDPSTNGVFVNP